MKFLTPRQKLTTNIKESFRADKVAERSRDDVYGSTTVYYIVIVLLVLLMCVLLIALGATMFSRVETVEIINDVCTTDVIITQPLPKTGALPPNLI